MKINVSKKQADTLVLALLIALQSPWCNVNTKKGEELYEKIAVLREQIILQTKSELL